MISLFRLLRTDAIRELTSQLCTYWIAFATSMIPGFIGECRS